MKFDPTEPAYDYKGNTIPLNDHLSKLFGQAFVPLDAEGKPVSPSDPAVLTLGDLLWEAMQIPDPATQQQGAPQPSIEEKRFCHKMSQRAYSGGVIEIDATEKEKIIERGGKVLSTAMFGMLDDALKNAEVDAEIAARNAKSDSAALEMTGKGEPPAEGDEELRSEHSN